MGAKTSEKTPKSIQIDSQNYPLTSPSYYLKVVRELSTQPFYLAIIATANKIIIDEERFERASVAELSYFTTHKSYTTHFLVVLYRLGEWFWLKAPYQAAEKIADAIFQKLTRYGSGVSSPVTLVKSDIPPWQDRRVLGGGFHPELPKEDLLAHPNWTYGAEYDTC